VKVFSRCPQCGWNNAGGQKSCDSCYGSLIYPETPAPGSPDPIEARTDWRPTPVVESPWVGFLVVAAVVFLLAAGVLAYLGWATVFDESYKARIVGGDAYNYIISAGRGTAYACIGIVCALAAVTFALFAVLERLPKNAR
jgi:hypothetical protein